MFLKFTLPFALLLLVYGCHTPNPELQTEPLRLTLEEANRLAELPLSCTYTEYPNKLNQTLSDSTDCPLSWEPSGFDFLSPCFQELDIMRMVLDKEQFEVWLKGFLPAILHEDFALEPAEVSDRSDGKLVHLDGLNFSRAWVLYGLVEEFPEEFSHLILIANNHIAHSLPSIVDDNYEGAHWLGSFAVHALQHAL